VVGVALNAGIISKTLMKKYFVTLFLQESTGYSFNADVALFMATDTLH